MLQLAKELAGKRELISALVGYTWLTMHKIVRLAKVILLIIQRLDQSNEFSDKRKKAITEWK
jgi:hypothetical protein